MHFAGILRTRLLHKPNDGSTYDGWLWKAMENLSLITYGCFMCVVFCFALCTWMISSVLLTEYMISNCLSNGISGGTAWCLGILTNPALNQPQMSHLSCAAPVMWICMVDISCDNKGTYHVASFLCVHVTTHGGPMTLLDILIQVKSSFNKDFHVTYCQSQPSIESRESVKTPGLLWLSVAECVALWHSILWVENNACQSCKLGESG